MAYTGSLPTGYNRATYIQDFQVYDDENGTGLSLSGATITLEVRKPNGTSAELTATTANGKIVITDSTNGIFRLTFTETDMRTLDAPMQYEVGIVIDQSSEKTQYLAGVFPVLDGIIS